VMEVCAPYWSMTVYLILFALMLLFSIGTIIGYARKVKRLEDELNKVRRDLNDSERRRLAQRRP